MRTPLDLLITERALHAVRSAKGSDILDLVDDAQLEKSLGLKNICVKVSPQLSDEIDRICGLLDIRKRAFLTAAFIEAIQRAEAIIDAEGVEDAFVEASQRHARTPDAVKEAE